MNQYLQEVKEALQNIDMWEKFCTITNLYISKTAEELENRPKRYDLIRQKKSRGIM